MSKLQAKVEKEYKQGWNYFKPIVEEKKKALEKVFPKTPEGEIRVHLLWKNMNLENALFSSDTNQISFTSEEGRLGDYKADNITKVAQFDYEDLEMDYDDEDIRMYNGLYGGAVRLMLGYNTEENQPISMVVNPLNCVPDPHNTRGSKMRFFGHRRKMSIDELREDPSYNVKQIDHLEAIRDLELRDREEEQKKVEGGEYIFDQEGLIDIYDHWTTFEGKKYFTTWGANRTIELRRVELKPLSKAEKKRPSKIDFGITIYRRKPKPFSFLGVSIADEVIQFQDALSKIYNLKLINANLQAHGNDMLVDDSLDIDLDVLSNSVAGGRKIGVEVPENRSLRDMVAEIPSNGSMSQGPENMINQLNQLSSETIQVENLNFGSSPNGSQTKGEIQTLMKNASVLLANVGANYRKGDKEYWKSHLSMYAKAMTDSGKKNLTFYENGQSEVLNLSKKDFIPNGKIQIRITSKKEENNKKDKNFAKISSALGVFISNLPQGSVESKRLLRKYGNQLTIEGFNPEDYIPLTKDERIAYNNLELLNNDIEIGDPQIGEDYATHLFIYNQAINTKAKSKAIMQYENAIITQIDTPQEMGKADPTTSAIAGNIVSSQESAKNQIASLEDI